MTEPVKVCKECKLEPLFPGMPRVPRPAPYPGPRCYTHHKARRRAVRLHAAQKRVERVYGLTPEQYDALYEAQGRKCAGCKRATGESKRLAVDHDHKLARQHDHPDDQGCVLCTRGLLCGPCNDVAAHYRDDPVLLIGFANYLIQPPAIGIIRAPE